MKFSGDIISIDKTEYKAKRKEWKIASSYYGFEVVWFEWSMAIEWPCCYIIKNYFSKVSLHCKVNLSGCYLHLFYVQETAKADWMFDMVVSTAV